MSLARNSSGILTDFPKTNEKIDAFTRKNIREIKLQQHHFEDKKKIDGHFILTEHSRELFRYL